MLYIHARLPVNVLKCVVSHDKNYNERILLSEAV